MMVETESENSEKIWKKFLRRHWKMLVFFVVAAALAIIGAIYVFLWFVGEAQVTGLVPTTLNLWSYRDLFVTFDFLGSYFHWNPGNYYYNGHIFSMVEKIT